MTLMEQSLEQLKITVYWIYHKVINLTHSE